MTLQWHPKNPWSPGTSSLPKAARKGKPRCNSDLPCAHQLSSCAIHLLMVTFRLPVAQRGEWWHHCLRQPSSGLHLMWHFRWHKKAREVFAIHIYLSCTAQKVSLCSQCCFELHGLTKCSAGINVTNTAWPVPVAFSLVFLDQFPKTPSSEEGE